MTNFSITAFGSISLNGELIPDGASRGAVTPADITGEGSFFIACNADQALQSVIVDFATQEEKTIYTPAPPVHLTLTDNLGLITIIDQNTRYPEEGEFPLLRPVRAE